MKNFLTLVRSQLKMNMRRDKSKSGGKKTAYYVGIFAIAFMYVLMMVGVTVFAVVGRGIIVKANATAPILLVLYTVAFTITFFLGTMATLNSLYFNKDTPFLLTLPIQPNTIFFAKFFTVYLKELMISVAVILLPSIVFGAATGAGVLFYIGTLLAVIVVPALPMIISSTVAIPLLYLATFFKNRGTMTTVFQIIIYAACMGVYIWAVAGIQGNNANNESGGIIDEATMMIKMQEFVVSFSKSAVYLLPLWGFAVFSVNGKGIDLFGQSGSSAAWMGFGISMAFVVVFFALAMLLSYKMYYKSLAMADENRKRKGKAGEFSFSSALSALVKKEWRTIIRTPAFGYQCLMGIIIVPLMLFMARFVFVRDSVTTDENMKLMQAIKLFIGMLMSFMFIVGSNITAITGISREGKGMSMLKSMPVSCRDIVKSKLFVSMCIQSVSLVTSFILLSALFQPFNWQVIPFIFFTFASSFAVACFCLKADVKHPKLSWTAPMEAIKHNGNVTVASLSAIFGSMFVGSIVCITNVLLANFLSFGWAISLGLWAFEIVVACGLAVFSMYMLFSNLEYHFEKM